MTTFLQYFRLWNNFCFGEISRQLPVSPAWIKTIFLAIPHCVLLMAIAFSGSRPGWYCSLLFVIILIWNVMLDQYSGISLNVMRQKITLAEKNSEKFFSVRSKTLFFRYIRINILVLVAIILGIIFAVW